MYGDNLSEPLSAYEKSMQFKRDLQEAKVIDVSFKDSDSSTSEAEVNKAKSMGRASADSNLSFILSQANSNATAYLAEKIRTQKIEYRAPHYQI